MQDIVTTLYQLQMLLKLKCNEGFYYLWNNVEKNFVVYFKVLLWIESTSQDKIGCTVSLPAFKRGVL